MTERHGHGPVCLVGSPISAQSRLSLGHALIILWLSYMFRRWALSWQMACNRSKMYHMANSSLLSFWLQLIITSNACTCCHQNRQYFSGVWRFEMQKLNHYAEKWWIVRGFGRLTVCLMRFVNNNDWLYSNCSSSRWRRSWFDCSFVFICR